MEYKLKLHNAIMHEINDLLERGKRHITVLLPIGCGRSSLVWRIMNTLQLNTIVIVSKKVIREEMSQRFAGKVGPQAVSVLSMKDISASRLKEDNNMACHNQLFILFDTSPTDREQLAKAIPPEATVISIGSDGRTKDTSFRNAEFYPFECSVFYTETLLDVRDIIVGTEGERSSIIAQITRKKEKQSELISIIRTAPYSASPEATEEELAALQEMLRERDRVIAEKDETIGILKALMASVGIPEEDIEQSVCQIKQIKQTYEGEQPEDHTEEVVSAILEQSQRLFARYVTPFSEEYYAQRIQASISKAVWKKCLVKVEPV